MFPDCLDSYHAVHGCGVCLYGDCLGYGIDVMETALAEHRKVPCPAVCGLFGVYMWMIPVNAYSYSSC